MWVGIVNDQIVCNKKTSILQRLSVIINDHYIFVSFMDGLKLVNLEVKFSNVVKKHQNEDNDSTVNK